MKKGLVVMLFLACAALAAGNVVVYMGKDHTGPEITVPQEQLVYAAGSDTAPLLNGVSARDNRDGDVTDTIRIESVIPNVDKTTASVIYVAKDTKNNVTKETRIVPYTEDASAAVQADASADQETQSTEVPGTETPAQTDQATAEPQADDGQAANDAAIAALSPESPKFYLTQYAVTVAQGAELNALSYVQEITDDKDSRDELYQGIQISGEMDTDTPGEYTLEYHVVDSDGNSSNTAQLKVTVQ